VDVLVKEVREKILSDISYLDETDDETLKAFIENEIKTKINGKNLSLTDRKKCADDVFNGLRRMGIIEDIFQDEDVTEVLINGPNEIYYEKFGNLIRYEREFESTEELEAFAQRIIGANNRMVNARNPIADGRLKDGSRVNVVLSPVSVNGTAVSIRRFPKEIMTMQRLRELGALSEEVDEFLKKLVAAGYNIFISGGTGSGKTTMLNALAEYIPNNERVITIEDSAELQLKSVDNLVRLETRVSTVEGVEEITIRDLIRTALRMRPDRIIVGECRGKEALDMLQALNTGHSGSLSTGHANSTTEALSRLEVMVAMAEENLPLQAIRGQISSGLDIMIHLGRMRDKSRKLLEISEIDEMKNGEIILNKIYEFIEDNEADKSIVEGKWVKTGSLKHTEKLKMKGIV